MPLKKILIIGKVWPEAKSSAAGTRMMQLISFFRRQNCDITFVSAAKKSGYEENLSSLGINCFEIVLNSNSFDELLVRVSPTLVLYDRFMTEEQFGWRVRKRLPDTVQVLNTEDLHFLRDARKNAVQKGEKLDITNIRSELLFRELASIIRCDQTLLVSLAEKKLLEKHYQISAAQLTYYPVLINKVFATTPTFEERKDMMFIGNFYHAPNWDALLYLKKAIWPVLRKKIPQAKLHIYGAYASQKVNDLNNVKENFLVHGRIDDALEVTKHMRLSLAPLRFGAGIKGKILEAMACATPFVTTEIGAEAMLSEKFNAQISKNTTDFIEHAFRLYSDKNLWLKSQNLGIEHAKDEFSAKKHEETLVKNLLNATKYKKQTVLEELLDFHGNKHYTYFSKWISSKT